MGSISAKDARIEVVEAGVDFTICGLHPRRGAGRRVLRRDGLRAQRGRERFDALVRCDPPYAPHRTRGCGSLARGQRAVIGLAAGPSIEMTGEVPDVRPYL